MDKNIGFKTKQELITMIKLSCPNSGDEAFWNMAVSECLYFIGTYLLCSNKAKRPTYFELLEFLKDAQPSPKRFLDGLMLDYRVPDKDKENYKKFINNYKKIISGIVLSAAVVVWKYINNPPKAINKTEFKTENKPDIKTPKHKPNTEPQEEIKKNSPKPASSPVDDTVIIVD